MTGDISMGLHDMPGYPIYFIQFISIAKVIGGITILIPGLLTLKEWAYAGLFFDLAGAVVSVIAASGKLDAGLIFIFIPVILGLLSYYFWKKTAFHDKNSAV